MFFCGLKSYAMEFVVKDKWILFLSYSNDLTIIWVEGHEPLSPMFQVLIGLSAGLDSLIHLRW